MNPGRLDIVCTNKGRHKRTRLTVITITDDSSGWRVGGSFHPPDELDGVERVGPPARIDGMPNEVFVLDCPRCSRTVELKPDTFRYLVRELLAHGVSRVDIGQLPF